MFVLGGVLIWLVDVETCFCCNFRQQMCDNNDKWCVCSCWSSITQHEKQSLSVSVTRLPTPNVLTCFVIYKWQNHHETRDDPEAGRTLSKKPLSIWSHVTHTQTETYTHTWQMQLCTYWRIHCLPGCLPLIIHLVRAHVDTASDTELMIGKVNNESVRQKVIRFTCPVRSLTVTFLTRWPRERADIGRTILFHVWCWLVLIWVVFVVRCCCHECISCLVQSPINTSNAKPSREPVSKWCRSVSLGGFLCVSAFECFRIVCLFVSTFYIHKRT